MDTATVISPEVEPGISPHGVPFQIPKHGYGKLQVGNPKATGRPKKAIRDKALKGADASVDDDLRILATSNDQVLRERAKDRLMRYGLGTQDEVQMMQPDQVLGEMAKALATLGVPKATAAEAVRMALESLGVSK